jgi:NAD(P)-dependent dehydrogenase (short-subunit alcohol dehydrogenase family)
MKVSLMEKHNLIVGGTSGLGLELAITYRLEIVTPNS